MRRYEIQIHWLLVSPKITNSASYNVNVLSYFGWRIGVELALEVLNDTFLAVVRMNSMLKRNKDSLQMQHCIPDCNK